jgi:hypothetical protein
MKAFPLQTLALALRGELADNMHWDLLIATANDVLLTPELFKAICVHGLLDRVPNDVREYLRFIFEVNCERNARLSEQLIELIVALNAAGIEPVLTKGAGELWKSSGEDLARMMYDIDITVSREELASTERCFLALGYSRIHGVGWARSQDAASVDIHFPPGRFPEYWPDRQAYAAHFEQRRRAGATALVQSPTLRLTHLVVHDMIKNGRWWLGKIDMRSLFEISHILNAGEIDWSVAKAILATRLARDCLLSELLSASEMFGVEMPTFEITAAAQRNHENRMLQLTGHALGPMLELYRRGRWNAQRSFDRLRSRSAAKDTINSAVRRITRSCRWKSR